MKRLAAAVVMSTAALLLTACSQVASLTPVGGSSVTSVRNAANDVLIEQAVPILVAPTCRAVDSGFACEGSTVDGAEILVTAAGTAPYDMVISVGGTVIFEGNAQAVLDAAVLEGS
jgi:hypothetical protein